MSVMKNDEFHRRVKVRYADSTTAASNRPGVIPSTDRERQLSRCCICVDATARNTAAVLNLEGETCVGRASRAVGRRCEFQLARGDVSHRDFDPAVTAVNYLSVCQVLATS